MWIVIRRIVIPVSRLDLAGAGIRTTGCGEQSARLRFNQGSEDICQRDDVESSEGNFSTPDDTRDVPVFPGVSERYSTGDRHHFS
jgi:hypothetical protein